MGGGVGRVLRNFIGSSHEQEDFFHQLICLDYANNDTKEWSKKFGIELFENGITDYQLLESKIKETDIVHIHFWNHPLLYRFLSIDSFPQFRAVIWSHVNGHHPPNIFTDQVLLYPDFFVISTEYSLSSDAIKRQTVEWREKNLKLVFETAGYEHVEGVHHLDHSFFNIGYIGTVSYSKMHRDFLEICYSIQIPDKKFIVCGGDDHNHLQKEADDKGYLNIFDFTGPLKNIKPILSKLDVFGYPLCKENYGTGEQVLIEAMACGVVPVVLDNGPERFIVEQYKSGIVASTIEEYQKAIEFLYYNPNIRQKMAEYAIDQVIHKMSIKKTRNRWHKIYRELLKIPQKNHVLKDSNNNPINHPNMGCKLFLLSLGETKISHLYSNLLSLPNNRDIHTLGITESMSPIFCSPSKGSVFHYFSFFPDDMQLKTLCDLTNSICKGKNNL
ncbi:glycosyltransferase family 4 protein [Methanospirillum lacunae]